MSRPRVFVKDYVRPRAVGYKRRVKPIDKLAYGEIRWRASDPALKRQLVLEILANRDGDTTVIRRLNALRDVSTSRKVNAAIREDLEYLRRTRY